MRARAGSSAPRGAPDGLLGGRFTVGKVLSETELSVLYAAVDEESGADVCIKRLRTPGAELGPTGGVGTTARGQDEAAVRFRREAAILSRVAHPHVVRVLAAGAGGEGTWFAMELLDGESLDRVIARGPLSVGRTLLLLRQVVDGLAYVHRLGVLHRDLKPHNIVVVANEARIIDFGLAADANEAQASSRNGAVVGTARYMAPEQAGLIWRAVGPRADLYAVGALAWEMLVGKPAFDDSDAGRLLRRIQCEAPPPLRAVAAHVPVALEKIVKALLEKNPDDRYQSAEALLHDLDRLERAWSAQKETNEDVASGVDFELTRATSSVVDKLGAIFVGREQELAAASMLADDVDAGRPRALLVQGRSGAGKSAYVAEVMGRLQARGAHIVTGKCAAVHAGVPYAALDDLLNAFLDVLERLPAPEMARVLAELREELGEGSGYVVRMSPAWGRVLDGGDINAAAGARAEHERVLDAVSAIAAALAPKDRMLVIFIDDLQWADASTVQLLRDLVDSMRGRRVMLIGAWRSDETSLRSPLRALVSLPADATRTVAVGPLARGDVRALLTQLLGGPPPERLVEILHTRSEGNAFFAWELLRAWARADAFRPGSGGQIEVDMVRLEATTLPADLVGIVLARLALLSPECRRVLGVASLVGRAFDLALVRACASTTTVTTTATMAQTSASTANENALTAHAATEVGILDDDAAYEALVAARDAQVLVQKPEGWSFAHDKVMEACGRFVDPMEHPAIERKIGEWLETLVGDGGAGDAERLFEIALHYGASDDEELALQWAVRAADASSALLRHQEALVLYENAERIRELMGEAETSPERLSLVEKKAAALDALGRYQEAEAGWLRALDVPREDLDTARLLTKLAQSQQKSGRYTESHENLLRALRLLGVRVRVEGLTQEVFSIVDRLRVFTVRGGPSSRGPTEREALVAEILTRLWYFHSFYLSGKNHRKMYTLAYKLLAATSSLGDCREKAIAHRLMAITLCQGDKPDFEGALEHSFRSVDIARRRSARMELAEAWLYVGIIHVWSARFSGAVEYLEKAAAMLEQIGNQWELANVHIFLFMAHKNLGRLDRALVHALEIVRVARRANASGSMVSGQSKLADVLLLQGDLKNGEDALRQSLALAADKKLDFDLFMATKVEGAWMIRAGRFHEAQACFQRALDLHQRNTFMRAYRADATVGWAESVVRARLASGSEGRADDAEVARAIELLDAAVAAEERSRLHFVYALRVRALAHLLVGQRRKAEIDAERAMTVVTREGHPLEHPHVLELHAVLVRERDPEHAAGLLLEARRLFLQSGAAAEAARVGVDLRKAGIADSDDNQSALESARRQADALLQVSLASSSTLDPRVQARAALDELVRVFDADRAFLFVARDSGELELDTARAAGGTDTEGAGWSSTVVERVRVRREPVVVTGEAEGALLGSQSAVLYDLRSIMAAPLVVRDRFLGVVYLDNRLDRGVRSREDVQLLQAIANHIAVAFESARSARIEVERHDIEKEKVLLEKDLALTGIVQSMFLPSNGARSLGGVQVAGWHRPATSSGGDWWAAPTAPPRSGGEHCVRVLVGDVTGHGAAPAMLTAAMSAVVRSAARTRPELTTPELVGELHATLLDVCKGAYQMTLAALEVAIVDGQASVRWWNAGAPPLLVVQRDGRVVAHTATGAPLGSQRFALEVKEITLQPGDRVLVSTDGVLEQRLSTRVPRSDSLRPGEARPADGRRSFGRKRVAQALTAAAALPIDETLQAIVAALDEARGSELQDDDLTLVMLAIE